MRGVRGVRGMDWVGVDFGVKLNDFRPVVAGVTGVFERLLFIFLDFLAMGVWLSSSL